MSAPNKKRSPLFFSVFFLVIMLVLYYVFAYIPKKEEDLQSRGIRVMNRMENNILSKEDHYEKTLDNYAYEYVKKEMADKDHPWDAAISIDPRISVTKHSDELVFFRDTNGFFVGLNAENLLKDIKHFTFFEDILLVDKISGAVLDSSILHINIFNYSSGKQIGKNVYDSDGKIVGNANVDTSNLISGVSISKQEISNTQFYCYTKVIKINSKSYYLTGLISIDNYNSQVRSVSVWVVVITFVFMVFLIQVLPIVKPFLMSPMDRMKSTDLMWSGISLVFGLSALVLFTLSIDTFVLEEKDLVDQKLEIYSDTILANFEEERKTVYDILLDYYESHNLNQDANLGSFRFNDQEDSVRAFNFIGHQKDHFSIIELNSKGNVQHYYHYYKSGNTLKVKSETNIKYRQYVKVHINSDSTDAWSPLDTSRGNYPTYVESIFSMASGQYETALSIKVSANKILVLIYPFSTVNHIYLEPNYQFAVINEKGVIQYHSDKSKIHNENIVDESNRDENLKAYLLNGARVHMDLKISLKDYSVFLTPISNTSFYFLTMYDIKKSRLTISSSMATTFLLIISVLLYLLLFHGLLRLERFMSNYPSSKAVTYYFINPSNTPDWMYYKLATLNVASALFLMLIYSLNELNLVNGIILFFGTITVSSLYNYHELTRQKRKVLELTYPIPSIRLTILELSLFVLSLFWISLFTARNLGSPEILEILYPICVLILYFFSKRYHKTEAESFIHSVNSKIYRASYIHTFSWIFILSVMSTILFFKPIYNRQHVKRVTHNLQEEYFERVKHQKWENHKQNLNAVLTAKDTVKEDDGSRNLLDAISVYFDKEDIQLKGLHKSKDLETTLLQNPQKTFYSIAIEPYSKYFNKENHNVRPTTIAAFSLPKFHFPSQNKERDRLELIKENVQSLFFWVILFVSLFTVYQTIVHLSEKFFHLKLAQDLIRISPREKIKLNPDKNDIIGLDWSKKNILLIGLPFSGRNSFLRQAVATINKTLESNNKRNENNPNYKAVEEINFTNKLAFDFINSTTEILEKIKSGIDLNLPIVINNYDYSITDFEDNNIKLTILEYILGQRTVDGRDSFLVLIGSLDIYQIIDIYKENIKTLVAIGASKEIIDSRKKDVDRWESVLYSFTKHIIPLLPKETDFKIKTNSRVKQFINNELNYTGLLSKIKPHIENYAYNLLALGEDQDGLESKIMQEIQSMAENYYFSVWNSFSKEEKFILLDLAQDDLINTANDKVIKNLIRKGIIVLDPNFQIFNKSFGNFIIESISEEESRELELESKKGGVWNSYKYLVIVLVIVIVIFLSFVEEQAFTQLTGIVSLGAAMVPRIIAMISSFASRKKIA